MSRYNYIQHLKEEYNEFKKLNQIEPNAVWVQIKMNNSEEYDTPYFRGYILLITDKQIDDYIENGTLPSNVTESEVIYLCSSINQLISDIENNHTEFSITHVEYCSHLPYINF